jgi:quercetin dioxygenase-like cupin family protein
MEIKRNEATRNRPEGDRVLDAPYVFADLPAFVEQVKDEKAWENSDRNAITVFKTDNMTIVVSVMKDGAVIKDNTVNGFLTVLVLEGRIGVATLEGDADMGENQLIAFHPGIPHTIEARETSVLLLTTYDVKE